MIILDYLNNAQGVVLFLNMRSALLQGISSMNFINWSNNNIYKACYKEHEGSFLVGMMAAMASQSGTIGFVGGMDIPLIRKFQGGY